jgi:acyl-CoA synthetase (AMP-forming)/AMP-acid ligase II
VTIYTDQTVLTFLKTQKDRCPNKSVLFFKEREVTYQQFFDRMEQVAYGLARFKIEQGDNIVICLPNGPESLFAFFGVLRRGAVAILLPTHLDMVNISEYFHPSQSHVLITTATLYAAMQCKRMTIPHLRHIFFVGDRGGEGFVFSSLYTSGTRKNEIAISPQLPALRVYPSKGERLTQEQMIASANTFIERIQMTEQDRVLYPFPWLDAYPQTISIIATIIAGGAVILGEKFSSRGFLEIVDQHAVTVFFCDHQETIKEVFASEEAKQYNLSSLRLCMRK